MKNLLFYLTAILFATSCTTTKPVVKTLLEPGAFYVIGVGAYDGDSPSFKFFGSDSIQRLRLYGIDAPEHQSLYVTKPQPYNKESAEFLRLLVKKDTLKVVPMYTDQFDRMVCKVYTRDSVDLSVYQLVNGNAWSRNEPNQPKSEYKLYYDLHRTARKNKLGLWALGGNKISPIVWRKRYSGWVAR